MFVALPDPTYLILGNVDHPGSAQHFAANTPAARYVDGQTVTLDGEVFGFVGGALPTPLRVAGEVSEEEFRWKVDAIGDVDVLCSHIPPAVDGLVTTPRGCRFEKGSTDLLEYIEDVQPRRAYFGHVHQPLVSSMHIGRTLCVNVGYFRATRRAWPHQIGRTDWGIAVAERVKDSIDIKGSSEEIFEVAADYASYPEWQDQVKKVEVLETDEDGYGTVVHYEVDAVLKKLSYTLDYDYSGWPKYFTWKLRDGDLKALDGRYSFDEFDDVTEVTYEIAIEPGVQNSIGVAASGRETDRIDCSQGSQERVESR